MNDPLSFTGTPAPTAISQSVTRSGQMLPDYDFSEARHKQISYEAVEAFFAGYDDIGMREERMSNGETLPAGEIPRIEMHHLERVPVGNVAQGQALLREQAEQERSLRRAGKAGPDLDYVRDRDYGRPDVELTGAAYGALIQEVKDNAKKYGVEL